MNNKMTTNSEVSTTEPKTQRQKLSYYNWKRIIEMEITWKVICGEGDGGKGTGNK